MSVLDGIETLFQRHVVTGSFLLDAHSLERQPGEWIEPVESAGKLGDCLREAIPPLRMCQLVQEHHPQPFRRPRASAPGKKDNRPEQAPRHRHRPSLTLNQAYRTQEAKLLDELFQDRECQAVVCRTCRSDEPPETECTERNGRQSQRCTS